MSLSRCPDVVEANAAGARVYTRHRPETTLLYQLVREHVATFYAEVEAAGSSVPRHVRRAFDTYLERGILAHGFARAYCDACRRSLVVAFSCKGRGVCPSCAARRMVDSAARLVDHVLAERPMRQWVLALPYSLRGLVAVLGDVLNAIAKRFVDEVFRWQRAQVFAKAKLHGAALVVPQLFGGSLNLAPHLHAIFIGGVFDDDARFEPTPRPSATDLEQVAARIARRTERWLTRRGYTFDPSAHDRTPDFTEQAAQTSHAGGAEEEGEEAARIGRRHRRRGAARTRCAGAAAAVRARGARPGERAARLGDASEARLRHRRSGMSVRRTAAVRGARDRRRAGARDPGRHGPRPGRAGEGAPAPGGVRVGRAGVSEVRLARGEGVRAG